MHKAHFFSPQLTVSMSSGDKLILVLLKLSLFGHFLTSNVLPFFSIFAHLVSVPFFAKTISSIVILSLHSTVKVSPVILSILTVSPPIVKDGISPDKSMLFWAIIVALPITIDNISNAILLFILLCFWRMFFLNGDRPDALFGDAAC